MRSLITGGAGFIGSHLARRLVERGEAVSILDDLSTGSEENIRNLLTQGSVELHVGSITDAEIVDRCVRSVDRVYHLAGTVGVNRVMDEPLTTIRDIVEGTGVVLDACARHGPRVFFASTSEVYGKSLDLGIAEGSKLSETDYSVIGTSANHRWAYATGKLLDEFLAFAHAREHGLDVVIGRFFNTVGPRQTGRYGMVLPRFIDAALENRPIVVYGNGSQRRTFLHVRDAVDAVTKLMASCDAPGRVFNIGHSQEISIRDLALLVNATVGNREGLTFRSYEDAYGPGFEDMYRRSADTARLESTVSWQPTMSIGEIVEDVALDRRSRTVDLTTISIIAAD